MLFPGSMRPPSKREIRRREQRERASLAAELRSERQHRARALAAGGGSLRVIARELAVSHQTVNLWLHGQHLRPDERGAQEFDGDP